MLQTILTILCLLALGWFMFRCLRRSEDPKRLIFKWFVTAAIVGFMLWKILPWAGRGGGEAWIAVVLAMMSGLVMFVTWYHSIGEIVAKPFSSLYTGGDEEVEPRPFYSVAQSKQRLGRYLEAVAEIRKQLDRFPTDFEGQMFLARIQAENLKDLPGAEITIQHLCAQPGHPPKNIAAALYALADWRLQIGQDRDAARQALEQVIELFPDSEFAVNAAHRIAHLGGPDMPLGQAEPRRFAVVQGAQNLGLIRDHDHLKPAEADPAQLAVQYVKHLEQHPLDVEAREKLAVIYADHYERLELATGELEQLIQQPNQPAKLVVHWLNLLADLQVRHGADYDTVKQTLQRIVDLDPRLPAAEIARHRLALLKLEFKANEGKQAIKMGTYEQNIGLKSSGRPGARKE